MKLPAKEKLKYVQYIKIYANKTISKGSWWSLSLRQWEPEEACTLILEGDLEPYEMLKGSTRDGELKVKEENPFHDELMNKEVWDIGEFGMYSSNE